jgi:hypothetical protein
MMPRIGEKHDPMFILCPNIGEHPTKVLKCTETWDFGVQFTLYLDLEPLVSFRDHNVILGSLLVP